tara:strand:+ start:837 stop:1115 length:279 start_codon:yes stop_codon:yes gene_type:complete
MQELFEEETRYSKRGEAFTRLAKKRVNATLRMFRLLGNLSNQSMYKYTDEQIDQMERAIDEAMAKAFTQLRERAKFDRELEFSFESDLYQEE